MPRRARVPLGTVGVGMAASLALGDASCTKRDPEQITLADGPVMTDADAEGRFAFLSVPRGTARLVVRQAEDGSGETQPEQSGAKAVTTPALMLL